MSEEMIVRHCAPTLAGLKTGAMFSCRYSSEEELREWLRDINRRLSSKGIRVVPLRKSVGKALIYVYRPSGLKRDMENVEATELLSRFGYENELPVCCIAKLRKKMKDGCDFPHEIGLFLGYPPCDVKGFIENGARASKIVGVWRVYGDEREAERKFSLYRECTKSYMHMVKNGCSIEELSVAVN